MLKPPARIQMWTKIELNRFKFIQIKLRLANKFLLTNVKLKPPLNLHEVFIYIDTFDLLKKEFENTIVINQEKQIWWNFKHDAKQWMFRGNECLLAASIAQELRMIAESIFARKIKKILRQV